MKIDRFEDLECWQEARKLVNMVDRILKSSRSLSIRPSSKRPKYRRSHFYYEQYFRRLGEQANAEFIRFLTYSRRSCAEVQNCLYVALDQEYITENILKEAHNQATKVIMILDGLIEILKVSKITTTKTKLVS